MQALEERGIGRPSTYASILGTILDRGYVFKRGTALVPSFLAFAVTGPARAALRRGSSTTTSPPRWRTTSTAIAAGDQERVDWLRHFYFGGARAATRACTRSSPTSPRSTRARSTRCRSARASCSASAATAPTSSAARSARASRRTWRPDELTVEKAQELLVGAGRRPRARHASRAGTARSPCKTGRYGPVRDRDARGRRDREAPRRLALQDDVARDGHPRGGGPAALAAPHARRRPGRRRGGHGAERPLRPVREEGHRLPLARERGAAVHDHARGRARAARPAEAAPWPGRAQAAAEASSARIRSAASRSWSRKAASGPTSPTARRTRAYGAATTRRR